MKLTNQEMAEFLRLVSAAAVANPFGSERDEIDRRLLAGPHPTGSPLDVIAAKTAEILAEVSPSVKNGGVTEQLLSDAALFVVFHKFADAFDEYIAEQNKTAGRILELPFADEIERELGRYGFKKESAHYIAIFFQMRRAFFFITRHVGGASEPVRALREKLWRSVFSSDLRRYISVLYDKMESFSLLLLGETGVGKGQAAAALGRSAYIPFDPKSKKFTVSFLDVFISANISEYAQNLVESELFGHKKGSFTGALENHAGLFAQTHPNGVLFLDEIGELPESLQVKLLRVLQDREFAPVGSHERKRFSGRLIAATNVNLDKKVGDGTFRSDLFYRLAADVVEIPPLRARLAAGKGELKFLLSRILFRLLGGEDARCEEQIRASLDRFVPSDYLWPGNLREFEQVIRRMLLHGDQFEFSHNQLSVTAAQRAEGTFAAAGLPDLRMLRWTADEVVTLYAQHAYEVLGSYEKVAQKLNVDWRTVKRWVSGG